MLKKMPVGVCLLRVKFLAHLQASPTRQASWNAAKFRHETRSLPNVAVPLYFRWVNKIVGDPNFGVNQGHVVVFVPGRGFLSSPGKGFGQQWFDSIVAVENYFGCTFVGWTEDINGKRVAEYVADPAPAPVAPAVNTGQGGDYRLVVNVPGFVNASDAANHANSNSTAPAGDYKIYNQANGMVNVTVDASKPGYWINPSDNVAPAPQPAAPAPAGFAVNDTVAPNSANPVSYDGVPLKAWDSAYTIIELNGDRAVLSARGAVWAAIRTSDIHKV